MADKMFDYDRHVKPYLRHGFVADERGYIVWRVGTGGNVELLHLKTTAVRQGNGRTLLRDMLRRLGCKLPPSHTPYHSVFGFALASNVAAVAFYGAMGFTLTPVPDVYRGGPAVLFSAPYQRLREVHGL